MPTNLPPDYYEIEKRFRVAETTEEKIELLQEMYSVVPKHKGTDHLPAPQARQTQPGSSARNERRHDHAFRIPEAGAGRMRGWAISTGNSWLL
jgi:ribosome-interacting GTPase 1